MKTGRPTIICEILSNLADNISTSPLHWKKGLWIIYFLKLKIYRVTTVKMKNSVLDAKTIVFWEFLKKWKRKLGNMKCI